MILRPPGSTRTDTLFPTRRSSELAIAVRGIRDADASDAPKFTEIMDELIAFVRDSSLGIHNAPFDLAFLNMELSLAGWPRPLQGLCEIIETLPLARSLHPGKRNNLDELCDR